MEYYIYLTNSCNLNCNYCSVIGTQYTIIYPDKIKYKSEELVQFINKVNRHHNDSDVVLFYYGGEPTLEKDKLFELMNHLSQSLPSVFRIRHILHTNGLLLNELSNEIISKIDVLFLSLNSEMMSGIDSSYMRKILSGTYKIRSIRNVPIVGRLTITETTNLLTAVSQTLTITPIVFWQLVNKTDSIYNIKFNNSYRDSIETLIELWQDSIKEGQHINLIPFTTIWDRIQKNHVKTQEYSCGFGRSVIYIQTDGSCHSCCDDLISQRFYIGNIDMQIEFPSPIIREPLCVACDRVFICMGRCARMHLDFSSERIFAYCALNKYTIDAITPRINEFSHLHIDLPREYIDIAKLTEGIP